MAFRSRTLAWMAGAALALISADNAFAHHSFGMFDMQKNATIEGTVKDYQWTNPHVWVDVLVTDASTNQPVIWPVEADSVAIMSKKGWARDTLKPGDKVAVVIHPLRKGDKGGSLVSASLNGAPIGHAMTFPDGGKSP